MPWEEEEKQQRQMQKQDMNIAMVAPHAEETGMAEDKEGEC